MAEFVNPIGQVRGKFGNVVGYVGPNGKNYCKGASLTRKPNGETQKRQSVAFATIVRRKTWMMGVIRVGFPGGKECPKGFLGFTSANVPGAVVVEKVEPGTGVNRRKKATREFQGTIDYRKLRVAAGALASPVAEASVDATGRKVLFMHRGQAVDVIDSFLDDRIYGVLLHEGVRRSALLELGTRGESFSVEVDFPKGADAEGLAIYVFATSAEGKEASDSVCLRVPGEGG